MKSFNVVVVFLLVFLVLVGFAQAQTPRKKMSSKNKGTLIGAGTGAVGGAVLGGGKGAIIGAAAGAVGGRIIGNHQDKKRAGVVR